MKFTIKTYRLLTKKPADKTARERAALKKLVRHLPSETQKEFINLWEEFEEAKTPEALFVKSMDKTEVLLQHDEADIKFMEKKEIPFNLYYGSEFQEHDKTLKLLRKVIDAESVELYKKEKIDEKLYKKYLKI